MQVLNKLAIVLTLATASRPLTAQPAFEVASVRQHQGTVYRNWPPILTSPLIRLEGYTIFGLVMDAFNMRDYQLDFGNARAEEVADTMYDIFARAPGDGVPRLEDVRAMLRSLLAERFQMRVHRESRERKVYALAVSGKKGPLLKPSSTPDADCAVHSSVASDGRNMEDTFTNCPVERLAIRLTNLMAEPVLDQTGLTGNYDFRLIVVPEYRTLRGSQPADLSPITAVSELGLKLVPKKAPVEILVIDSFERPAAN